MSVNRRAKNVVNFTQKGMTKLRAEIEGRSTWFFDEGCEGLALSVRSTGLRVFYLVGKLGQKATRKKLGRWGDRRGELSVDEARKKCRILSGELANGIELVEDKQEKRAMTVKELFLIYVEQGVLSSKTKRARSPKTTKDYRFNYDNYVDIEFGHREIGTLTREEVNKWHGKLGEKHKYKANRCLIILKCMLNYALNELELIDKNPVLRVKPFDEEKRERKLNDDELKRFWKACDDDQHRDFWLVGLLTGQRQAEVLSMRWKDLSLDLDKPMWRIPRIKGGREGLAYISHYCRELLTKRREASKSEWVFPSPTDQTKSMVIPLGGWIRVCSAAGLIEDGKHTLRRHDLRRSLSAIMRNKCGVPLEEVGAMLNHKPNGVTLGYAGVEPETVWVGVNKANEYMVGLTK